MKNYNEIMIELESTYNKFIDYINDTITIEELRKKHKNELNIIEQKIKQFKRKAKLKRLGLIN